MRRPTLVRTIALVPLALGSLALGACGPFGAYGTPFERAPVHRVSRPDRAAGAHWVATLASADTPTAAGERKGSATMTGGSDGRNTYVAVDLLHAAPGGVHPWRLRRGQCGVDGGAFGPAEGYRTMTVDDQGRASGSVTVALATPTEGRYYVTVAASAAHPETTIACGNLARTAR
jgi:hypothetical protein